MTKFRFVFMFSTLFMSNFLFTCTSSSPLPRHLDPEIADEQSKSISAAAKLPTSTNVKERIISTIMSRRERLLAVAKQRLKEKRDLLLKQQAAAKQQAIINSELSKLENRVNNQAKTSSSQPATASQKSRNNSQPDLSMRDQMNLKKLPGHSGNSINLGSIQSHAYSPSKGSSSGSRYASKSPTIIIDSTTRKPYFTQPPKKSPNQLLQENLDSLQQQFKTQNEKFQSYQQDINSQLAKQATDVQTLQEAATLLTLELKNVVENQKFFQNEFQKYTEKMVKMGEKTENNKSYLRQVACYLGLCKEDGTMG